jgi:hypothetical protein
MEIKPGLHRIGTLNVEEIRRHAERAGFFTFVLPASGISDRASFNDAVRATFPLDPPLVGSRSWEALSDSLWQGLFTHDARRIAILWPNAQAMASSASSDFDVVLNVLADIVSSLADPRMTRNRPKEVTVMVE